MRAGMIFSVGGGQPFSMPYGSLDTACIAVARAVLVQSSMLCSTSENRWICRPG
jgi:hypothetical protein